MDQDVRAQGAVESVVGVGHRCAKVRLGIPGEPHRAHRWAEHFLALQVATLARGSLDEASLGARTLEVHQVRGVLREGSEAFFSSGIVQATRRRVAHGAAHFVQQSIRLVPVRRQDQHLASHTVEARVVEFLGGDLLGLERQIGTVPGAWNHDGRADCTQLRGDALGEPGGPCGAVGLAFCPRAPDDDVVRGLGASDVDLVDRVVAAQVRAFGSPSAHDPEGTDVDQGCQGGLQERSQVVVHRVELEQHDLVLGEQLLETVQWRDGGDVASPEHERRLPWSIGDRCPERRGRVLSEVLAGHSGLHPDLGVHPREQQVIPHRVRSHRHHELSVRMFALGQVLQVGPLLHARQRLDQQTAGCHHCVRTRHPLLSHQR
jgi:hypothetical protein